MARMRKDGRVEGWKGGRMGGQGAAEALKGIHYRETKSAKKRHELLKILWWKLLSVADFEEVIGDEPTNLL